MVTGFFQRSTFDFCFEGFCTRNVVRPEPHPIFWVVTSQDLHLWDADDRFAAPFTHYPIHQVFRTELAHPTFRVSTKAR